MAPTPWNDLIPHPSTLNQTAVDLRHTFPVNPAARSSRERQESPVRPLVGLPDLPHCRQGCPVKTSPFLCLCLTLAISTICQAESTRPRQSLFEQALHEESDGFTYRGQSPGPVLLPPLDSTTVFQQPPYDPNTQMMSPNVNGGVPYDPSYPAPVPYDPWSNGDGSGGYPYGPPPGTCGLNGPQPYRFNTWTNRVDGFYMADAGTNHPNLGDFGMSGVDMSTDRPIPIAGNWVLTPTLDYGGRFLSGPNGGLTNSHLPADLHRFGLGVKLSSPMTYGWGIEASIEPWIASDLDGSLTSKAWLFDGQIAALWQMSPQLMWIFGVSYWDRVDSIILPYGGVVWTPNEFWEFRLVFPKPRITAFIGAPLGIPTWAYASAEYHVEAYEVNSLAAGKSDLVQFSDWRAMGGLRWETPRVTSFIEAGYVFDRKVKFDKFGGAFKVDSGFMTRVGVRF